MLCIISCLFLQELLLYAVRKTFQARWRYQDPPLNVSSWTSCDYFFFQDFFWLSHFTYHISASLPWYQICWITGLGYCIIYFALEVLVWRPGLPSCIWNSVFSLSLFMIFASGVFKSSFDCFLYPWHVQIGLFPKPKVYICLFSLTVKKNLIFNFNQCYFTYCRDSNLCDFRQPKYCSVQFCVWTVSVHSQQSWEFCIH